MANPGDNRQQGRMIVENNQPAATDLPPGPWELYQDVVFAPGNVVVADFVSRAVAELLIAARDERDETMIDVDWMEACVRHKSGYGVCLTEKLAFFNSRNGWQLCFNDAEIIEQPIPLAAVKTRGDVRRLCAALGIQIAPDGETPQ